MCWDLHPHSLDILKVQELPTSRDLMDGHHKSFEVSEEETISQNT